jgi:hypothetical protein
MVVAPHTESAVMRSTLRREKNPELLPPAKSVQPKPDEQYAGAFARVRLVRAWIGAAAAMVALGYAFNTLLDRMLP